jgi:hypothetical protein
MKFSVFDATESLFTTDYECEAPTARHALEMYLHSKGLGGVQVRNTSDFTVRWKTTPYEERDGRKYQAGRISWWGIKPTKIS